MNLAALILVSKINVTSCYIDCVTTNLAALILVPSEPDLLRMEIQTFVARPPNSKMIVNMFYFWNKGSKNVQNFFIPNFQIVFISVFSAPRTLIAIFCLFSCFLRVIRSRTGIGVGGFGSLYGPFSFSCYVLLGPRPHLQLSSAKETNTADTVEVASKVPVWWATAGVGPH